MVDDLAKKPEAKIGSSEGSAVYPRVREDALYGGFTFTHDITETAANAHIQVSKNTYAVPARNQTYQCLIWAGLIGSIVVAAIFKLPEAKLAEVLIAAIAGAVLLGLKTNIKEALAKLGIGKP